MEGLIFGILQQVPIFALRAMFLLASLGSLFLKVLKNKEKLERKKDSVVTSESMKEQFEIYLYCLSFIQFTLFYFLQFLIFQFSVFKLYYSQNTRPPKN